MKATRYILTTLLMAMMAIAVQAQNPENLEYRVELGAGINMTSYQGDCSEALFGNMQPGGSVLFRAILNPRSAVRIGAMVSSLKGDVSNAGTVYPDITPEKYSFKNTVADLTVAYEYNFFPYGTGKEYRGAQRVTPFVLVGLGLTYVNSEHGKTDFSAGHYNEQGEYVPQHESTKSVITGNIPLGVGVKYKLGARTNLSLDWQFHISFSDYLDGVKDPYRISSSGLFKNMDTYSAFTLALTYSLSPKCSTCHNSDWHF